MKTRESIDALIRLMEPSGGINRRQFLKRMGILSGGLVIYFSTGSLPVSARTPREGFLGANIPEDFNAFLRISANNTVVCYTGKIEMGQGPITSLPQMIADELDMNYDAVSLVMGDTDLCPWDAGTFGSLSTRHFGMFLREAAAEAKGVLKELAQDVLQCPPVNMETKAGEVIDTSNPKKRVSYGQLTQGKFIARHLKELPPLKKTTDFTVMGKSMLREDALEKVTGRAKYAGDIRLPGMRYAKILRPPAHGATLSQLDTSGVEKIPGVEIVRDEELVAVLHELPDVAIRALSKVKADFSTPQSGLNNESVYDHFLKNAPQPRVSSEDGDVATGAKAAQTLFDETYTDSYTAHAPMEPHAALAQYRHGKLTVWASTQSPFGLKRGIMQTLNLPENRVRVITPFVGGGFGGKNASQQAIEAARLAKLAGRPVQVAWSREEEFFYDTFRPGALVTIKSGIDAQARITHWDYRVYGAGSRGSEQFYAIKHHRSQVFGGWRGSPDYHPLNVGPWRAPAANTNTYARDLHLNLMAAKAGIDPLEFRLKNLSDPRMIQVLRSAAETFGWQASQTPSGQGVGISCGIDAGTYVATMAKIQLDRQTGAVEVKRIVCAQDMGYVVNPQGATIQMEGCITMGLGYALGEEIQFEKGRVLNRNFDEYNLPRFSWLPEIETVLVANPELSPQGGGEPAIICMGGVIATAIHDATGAKPIRMPMTAARVRDAMQAVV